MAQRRKGSWSVVLIIALSVLGTLAIGALILALYLLEVKPSQELARKALDRYVDAQRRGVAPELPPYQATPDRVHADRILAQSTSLDVEVGHWRFGSNGDWVCFEGTAQTPSGQAPLLAALARSDGTWTVRALESRAGCECSADEERIVECP